MEVPSPSMIYSSQVLLIVYILFTLAPVEIHVNLDHLTKTLLIISEYSQSNKSN